MLEHHHTCEDRDLWPMIVSRAPHLEPTLDGLTAEHERLQEALDDLAALDVEVGDPAARTLAVRVRDLVHEHLDHEEPVLLPALDCEVSDADWAAFSRRTVASSPQDGLPFLLAHIDEVAPPADA